MNQSPGIKRNKAKLKLSIPNKSSIKDNIVAFENPQNLYRESLKQMADYNKDKQYMI